MKTFEVCFRREIEQVGYVTVDAESMEEAKKIANHRYVDYWHDEDVIFNTIESVEEV